MTKQKDNRTQLSRVELGVVVTATLFALLIVPSCQNESGTTPRNGPVVERTSVHYMLPPVNKARTAVLNAEEMLVSDPPNIAAARESLGKARGALTNLEWFYVPATEARENVYNAYVEHLAGHPDQSKAYLDSAKRGLLEIAARAGSGVEPYVKDLVDRIDTLQFQIRAGEPLNDEVKSLCETFQLHLLKAQLVLDEGAFEKQD
jgi:hypothetical protein